MSDPTRWLRIKELFRRSQQQPESARDAWLVGQCGDEEDVVREVRALLAAQRGTHDILDQAAQDTLKLLREPDPLTDLVGQKIGAYRLQRLLGEGGMGSVYLAERTEGDLNLRAALKLIRADVMNDEARARFLRERRILSQLHHPHIAQLHDGGVAADGTPYFTLEYVEGEPITQYCDARKFVIRDRLRLVLQVCAAVAYAHRNLIVHRDLKPSNIFVTAEGEVKLLDFGIAKLIDADASAGQTATQARMMTPEYAAPEQVLGEPITTATDLYAIGVLLYELLCGRLPYARADAGAISWSKAVVEETPEPVYRALYRTTTRGAARTGEATAAARGTALPGLRRILRGDLDRILQRALSKTPDARYATVGALASDLDAYLQGHAISGGTRTYQIRKFVGRHWLPLAAAATILAVVIGSGTAIVWQAERTEREARTTLAVKDFLYGLFTAVDPHVAKGREVSAHELLDRGAQSIDRNKSLDVEQKAEIKATLGRIYWQLGMIDQADKLQDSAITALAGNPDQTLLLARTEAERAATQNDLGDLKTSQTLADDARSKIDALRNVSIADRVKAVHAQSLGLGSQRDFAKMKKYSEQEVAWARQIADIDSGPLFHALMTAGTASWGLGQNDQAEATWREALALASRDAGPDDLDTAMARTNVANALQVKSQYAQAKLLEEQALATEEKLLGADHPMALALRRDLALSNYHLGYYAQARAMMEQVIAAQRTKFGPEHPAIAGSEINLGYLLLDSGDADAAERALSESVGIFDKKYGREFQGTRIALRTLAAAHIAQGKLDRADQELNEVKAQEEKLGLREKEGDETDLDMGDLKRLQGDAQTAVALSRQGLAVTVKKNGQSSRYAANAHQHLALALGAAGDNDGAQSEFRASLASLASYIPNAEDPTGATTRYHLGMLLLTNTDTRAEGIRLLNEAADLREKFLGADDPATKKAQQDLRKARSMAGI